MYTIAEPYLSKATTAPEKRDHKPRVIPCTRACCEQIGCVRGQTGRGTRERRSRARVGGDRHLLQLPAGWWRAAGSPGEVQRARRCFAEDGGGEQRGAERPGHGGRPQLVRLEERGADLHERECCVDQHDGRHQTAAPHLCRSGAALAAARLRWIAGFRSLLRRLWQGGINVDVGRGCADPCDAGVDSAV